MKNQWTMYLKGKVLVKAEGLGTERFLNRLTRSGLSVWNVKKIGTKAVVFYIQLEDLSQFRKIARNFEGRITFLEGSGGPFIGKRLIKNSGLLAGVFAFLVLLAILSNMVWGIEISGASPEMEHAIRKELKNMGIQKGKLQFFLDDVDSIQRKLTSRVEGITWVGVHLNGTTYHFQVVEKTEPKKKKTTGPQDLVAKKKAVIVKMFVEKGQPVVKRNQYVQKGQLLVSGLIGNEEQPKEVASKGKVWGETWYKSSVELPLNTTFQVYTGKEKRIYFLKVGKFHIPVWGWWKKESYKLTAQEENRQPIKFFKWNLPIEWGQTIEREYKMVDRRYTVKQAIKEANILARKDLKKHLQPDAQITGEKILHQRIENGKVMITVYFQVIEDIAKGQPIIQGDKEDDRRNQKPGNELGRPE